MSYAAILVHVEARPVNERRLALAADLANQFGAALVGLGAEIYEPPVDTGMGYLDGEVLVAEAKLVREDLQRSQAKFRDVAKSVQAGSEWGFVVAVPSQAIVEQAGLADLIVAGPRRREPIGLHTCADPGDVVMGAGRPVLVTPPHLAKLDASSIVVGWKNTREARRALSDALPFLKRANQVTVAEICEHQQDEAAAADRLADVVRHLERHGVKAAQSSRARGKATTAEALLDIADLHQAGLLVVGGYGHARLREWAFGGVTWDLLGDCGRAVLFSH